jgi:hypothetical protein
VARDQRERATMSLLIPPQMINTMDEKDLWSDPVRRYMLPAFEDRDPEWPSHPKAQRDSLHEADMWAVEGLTHRYPTKVLAELLPTCPQYCGHCTRMDLVGNDVPQVEKHRFEIPQKDRYAKILDYLKRTPSVRDVVVSGGDIGNLPIATLEKFVSALMDLPNIRDIRLRHQGFDGPAAALPAGRRAEGIRADGREGPRARHRSGGPHPRQQRPLRSPPGRPRRRQAPRHGLSRRAQPGACCCAGEHDDRGAPELCFTLSITRASCRTTSICAT